MADGERGTADGSESGFAAPSAALPVEGGASVESQQSPPVPPQPDEAPQPGTPPPSTRPITGSRGVRISDVAAAAGVSKALVSYALNGKSGVSEATRGRIVDVARMLGWTPSVRARSLSKSRAYAVGLVFRKDPRSLASDQYYTSLMAGMGSVLSMRGYSLVTEVVADADAEAAAYRRLARDGRIDGVVLADLRDDDPRFALAQQEGLAFVSLGEVPAEVAAGMPELHHDESPAVEAVVDHLVGLGHRRIDIVAGPQELVGARTRREAYQQALRTRGLDDEGWVSDDYTPLGGESATATLLNGVSGVVGESSRAVWGAGEGPGRVTDPGAATAIVYANDLMAIGGIGEAVSRGLRIPRDLSIVGWDDIVIAPHLFPGVSTVHQYPFDDGRTAAAALLDAIAGRVFDHPVRTPDPRFIPRGSTGPVRPGVPR